MNNKSQAGFTLIEVVVILISLGIAAVMATPMVLELVRGPESARKTEAAIVAQQQCAERIIAARSAIGFTLLTTNLAATTNYCSELPSVDGVSATVSIAEKTSGTCLSGQLCKEVTIGAIDSTSKSAVKINPVTLMLVKY